MKHIRLFKNKQDYSNEIGNKMKIDLPNLSVVSGSKSMFLNANAIREAYLNVTSESYMNLINDYRMFSEIYLNDGTENLVPKLVEDSFTIDANDLVKVNETTWRNTNPKKYNSTYVNSFIVSCDEEILDDYYIGFSGLMGFYGEGMLMRDITLMGTLNELGLKDARINSNTIDLTHFFIYDVSLVNSINVVIFKPNENGELIPLTTTTTNTYASNIIEEKTYDISETPNLEDFSLLDFTLKCEQDILPTDILFTYGNVPAPDSIEDENNAIAPVNENNAIVPLYTIEQFLTQYRDELCVDLIDSKTLGRVSGYFPIFNYITLCGIMRDGEILTQEVNILGINSSEYGNYSLSTNKLGENKIKFKIPNRFRTPFFGYSYNLTRLNSQALKYNKVITPWAFAGSTSLSNITIPDSVTTIGEFVFQNCNSLTSITIPNSVTTIGDYAFQNCNGLISVNIGSGVTSIGYGVFQNCTSLSSVTIPDSITSIGEYAFNSCISLSSVTIPDSITSIGECAFSTCYNLTSVNIPDSVTEIGGSAFQNCESLSSVNIPDGVTTIGEMTFARCTSLSSVNIPDSVTSIGYNAFHSCQTLKTITCHAATAPSLGTNSFKNVYQTGVLRVPTGSDYSTWQSALPSGWTIEYI